jgi:general secretion pathway protein D
MKMMRSCLTAAALAVLLVTTGLAPAQEPPAAAPEDDTWEFRPNADGVELEELFNIIHGVTGVSIVYNKNDPALKSKRVTFTGSYRVPRSRIFDWLQAVLSYQKLILVPIGPRGHQQWALLNLSDPAIANHPVYVPEKELDKWADRDGVFIVTTFTVKKLRDTTRARNALANLVTRPTGRIQDVPGTQSFVVGDFAPVVCSMARLVRAMDITNVEYVPIFKVVRLEWAVASELEPIIQDLLAATPMTSQSSRSRGQQTFGVPEKPEPVVRADSRQEALVIYAVEEDVARIEAIIRELDTEPVVDESRIQIYPCKHTLAEELAETLNDLIRTTGMGQGQTTSRTGRNQPRRPTSGAPGTSSRDLEVVVVPDAVANSLLIQADRRTLEHIMDIIEQLDIRRPQVLIEAALIELRINDNLSFGVELAATDRVVSGNRDRTGFGVTHWKLTDLVDVDGDSIPDVNIPGFASSGLTFGIYNNEKFPLVVQAFQGFSKAKALSMPSVVVDDNREAEISTTQSEPYRTTETTQGGTDRENVKYVDVASTLRISPHISSSNYLKLHIELEISSFGTRLETTLPPPTQSRILKTDIVVPDQATLIMGGIIDNRTSETDNKVPILGDIPLLGYLFKQRSVESFKTNLFLFVTPTILGKTHEEDLAYFEKYHEVSWSRKLLAEKLIEEELEIYNSRFRASEPQGEAPAESPEDEMSRIEDSGLVDFAAFETRPSSGITRARAKEVLEREREAATVTTSEQPGR